MLNNLFCVFFMFYVIVCRSIISVASSEDGQPNDINQSSLDLLHRYLTGERDDTFNLQQENYLTEELNDSRWPTIMKPAETLSGTYNDNLFVDIALQSLRSYILSKGYMKSINLPDYHLNAHHYDVYLQGGTLDAQLPPFQRSGDNTVTATDESLTFDFKIGIGRMGGMYNKLVVQTWLFRETYQLWFHVDSVDVRIQILFNLTHASAIAKDCEITKIGTISITAHGDLPGIIDWLGRHEIDTDSFKRRIANDMNGKMKDFVQKELDKLFPKKTLPNIVDTN